MTEYLAFFFCLAWVAWGVAETCDFVDRFYREDCWPDRYSVLVAGIIISFMFGIFERVEQVFKGPFLYWRDLRFVITAQYLAELAFYLFGLASLIVLVLGRIA